METITGSIIWGMWPPDLSQADIDYLDKELRNFV